jgi:hypothetical protein
MPEKLQVKQEELQKKNQFYTNKTFNKNQYMKKNISLPPS